MKKPFIYISFALLLAFAAWLIIARNKPTGDSDNRPGEHSNLIIEMDSLVYRRVGNFTISPYKRYTTVYSKRDSTSLIPRSCFDSIPNGKVAIHILTMFGNRSTISINLQSDTLIRISPLMVPTIEIEEDLSKLPVSALDDGEKMTIIYVSGGCFSSFDEKLLISRKDNTYNVEFIPGMNSWMSYEPPRAATATLDSSFTTSLTKLFRNPCYTLTDKGERVSQSSLITNFQHLYVNRRGKLYCFRDCSDGFATYMSLLKSLSITNSYAANAILINEK